MKIIKMEKSGKYLVYWALVLIGISISTLACSANQSQIGIEVGSNTCGLPETAGRQYVDIRGTGYFWVEHWYRGLSNKRQLVLLVEGKNPVFADRKSASADGNKCEDKKIVSFLWLPENMTDKIINFGCHITDDQPYQSGEITFGYADKNEVGLRNATKAWKALVHPFGKGGVIEPVDSKRRVLCTVFPGID